MSVLAIDLETKNMSYEIGGWDNTHMFLVSTVCTWDGDKGTIYMDSLAQQHLVRQFVSMPIDSKATIEQQLLEQGKIDKNDKE